MKETRQKIDEYFRKVDALGWDPGLRSILELLKRLGNPQNQISVVHAAGTNGKGSTLAFLSSIMETTGIRVGRFTSPHMIDRREMIVVNGIRISDSEMERGLEKIEKVCEEMIACGFRHPTSFEVMTALAFLHFADQADLALIETGMGGRLDATNVVEAPKLCIITSIGMDHEAFLGDCLESIAGEKAGIFRPFVPIVSAVQDQVVEAVLQEKAESMQAPLIRIDLSELSILEEKQILRFVYQGREYQTNLLGRHQAMNAAVAIESAKKLRKMGWKVSEESLVQGILHAKWPGRFEILRKESLLVIDGAHNAQGMRALNVSRKQIFRGDFRAIVGVLGEKELGEDFLEILRDAKEIWTATPDNPRALSAKALSDRLLKQGIESEAKAVDDTLIDLVLNDSMPCLIFGSLYLIGPLGIAIKRRLNDDSYTDC